MRVIDRIDIMNRRTFGRSVGTAALLGAVPLAAGSAYAADGTVALKTGPASALPVLVKMARDLYPHDKVSDEAYAKAVATIDDQFAENKKATMGQGALELDGAAKAIKGKPYLELASEDDRVFVLRHMEKAGTPFFKAMRAGMITALYNQEELWPGFGYEGSSAEKGGYLHRGFNDLDWLPA
ncbi:Twin-arginine translocation pathway signal [Novosphingobium terrae]|uniref:Twin-arginine translocation pathway signal n=1 Tax=Novosphingobium terrae TaxID=2726189 RepID=UPI00197EB626|nr:Twin-arginine translocation pathway signal [Novosphingobium terrae]